MALAWSLPCGKHLRRFANLTLSSDTCPGRAVSDLGWPCGGRNCLLLHLSSFWGDGIHSLMLTPSFFKHNVKFQDVPASFFSKQSVWKLIYHFIHGSAHIDLKTVVLKKKRQDLLGVCFTPPWRCSLPGLPVPSWARFLTEAGGGMWGDWL